MLIDKVKVTIKKYNILQKHDRILVGLSGGPDSVTLLYVLFALTKEYLLNVHVAHLNHKIRGGESASDRRFCEEFAKKLNLDIVCEEIDVTKIAKEKNISLEEAARFERYGFFKRTADAKKIKKVAVGHTRDDQAETVLMRAIRGSGMLGLGGISPIKDIRGLTIIRPLIEISRQEIEDFVRDNDLQFKHDSSNDKVIFTRNRIRHELIPYLQKNFNPNIKEILSNTAENLRLENEFLEKFARRKFRSMAKKNKSGGIIIDIKKFKTQSEAIRKRVLRSALEEVKGNLRRFTYQHWKEMESLIDKRPGNSIVDLPGRINIVKSKDTLIVEKENVL
ncbi:tRNA lysidine(34) synthetase TilS [Candidatus Omnitrophota bacterium]